MRDTPIPSSEAWIDSSKETGEPSWYGRIDPSDEAHRSPPTRLARTVDPRTIFCGNGKKNTMTGHRTPRLNQQFKREISGILSRKVRDPRVGSLLITEARVTADLWVARVFFRQLDPDRNPEEVLAGLEAAGPFIRSELSKILSIRRIPELRFEYDTSFDSANRIEELLREVFPEGGDGTEGEEGPEGREDGSGEDVGSAERAPPEGDV